MNHDILSQVRNNVYEATCRKTPQILVVSSINTNMVTMI